MVGYYNLYDSYYGTMTAASGTWGMGFISSAAGSTVGYAAPIQYYPPILCDPYVPAPETEECKQARLAREAEHQRLREAEQRQRDEQGRQQAEANNKAKELFRELFGDDMLTKLDSIGYVELDSQKHKGCKYRVRKAGRIEVLDSLSAPKDLLCIVPALNCPDYDKVISKIILLQCDEDYVLATANHSRC